MPPDFVETIIGYHDRTKHHPGRYARSLGYLDWATQPDPFRRFEGTPLLRLPVPPHRERPSYGELFAPGAIEPRELSLETVSEFLYLSLALSAWKQAGPSRWALRVNPSSGNLHPTEGYVILPALSGLHEAPTVCHYAPREHALERRARLAARLYTNLLGSVLDASAPPAFGFLVGLTSIYWREAWKYGERAFRYCNHDVGHALAALRVAAAALGWRLLVLEGMADDEIARMLGIDRDADFDGREREAPDVLAVVVPADWAGRVRPRCDSRLTASFSHANWEGRANLLSPEHVDWDIIDAAHEATCKPASAVREVELGIAARSGVPATEGPAAYHVIRTRRSAVSFDGRTIMPAATFFRVLGRCMPEDRVPWDCVPWQPRIHLFLFVHLVEGLAPGLYALVRDVSKLGTLRQACDPKFAWTVPEKCPSGLPLFRLLQADCRRAAAQLSLGQEIAGMSAFSLAMVGEFEAGLRDAGPWRYRRLFWEAGMVGQVLYLEAEAAGLRGTGIGAYFDDLVHDTLGLSGHRFQSLYHFTVGGAIEDLRVLTEPAYPSPA